MYRRFFIILTAVLTFLTLATANVFTNQAEEAQASNDTNSNQIANQIDDNSESDSADSSDPKTKLEVVSFYQTTCGVCREVKPTLEKIRSEYAVDWNEYEVTESEENRSRFGAYANKYGIDIKDNHVPVVYVGDSYFMGQDPIENELEKKVAGCVNNLEAIECKLKLDPNSEEATTYNYTGNVSCSDGTKCQIDSGPKLSLWLVLTAAAADSINPCAIAVLVLLITYLLNIDLPKRKMLGYGLIYIGTVFTAYFLAGLGILKFLSSVELSETITYIIAGIVILVGLINLKDALFIDKKSTLAIPDSAKPYLKKYISKATLPSLIIVGFIVAAVELPCTGAVYLGILSLLSEHDKWTGILYLLIYNLIFIAPLVIILLLAVKRKDLDKVDAIRKSNKRWVKIVMSIVMFILAYLLLSW